LKGHIDPRLSQQRAIFVKTDVSKEEDVKNLISEAEKTFGKVNIVFNNAGLKALRI
jgi:NAD(P)-dependent dehydrogenase (short-subunit alcohol dehydrogenase family)